MSGGERDRERGERGGREEREREGGGGGREQKRDRYHVNKTINSKCTCI